MGPHLLELVAIFTLPRRYGKGDADLRFSVFYGLRAITNTGRGGVGRFLCGIAAALRPFQGDAPFPPAIFTLSDGEGADLLVLRRIVRVGLAVPGGLFFPGRIVLRRVDRLQVCGEVPLLRGEVLLLAVQVLKYPCLLVCGGNLGAAGSDRRELFPGVVLRGRGRGSGVLQGAAEVRLLSCKLRLFGVQGCVLLLEGGAVVRVHFVPALKIEIGQLPAAEVDPD